MPNHPTPGDHPVALPGYYDRLGIWTSLVRPFGYGGGSASLTVHRLLADPRHQGRPTATRLHDLIAESLPPLHRPRILDAGCGLGGTMLDLSVRYDGTAIGLTLSEGQRERATQAIVARGLTSRVEARVHSYDEPPPGPFDLVVAIESLAHSQEPNRSIAALAAVLSGGGRLVVVDDMPEPDARRTLDFERFRSGWHAPVVWGRDDYLAAFTRLGLEVAADSDLTTASSVRTLSQIARMERLNRFAYRVAPRDWRVVLDSYYGGLALERLYRHNLMHYRMLIAERRV